MKIAYVEGTLSARSLKKLAKINEIIEYYQELGYKLTLRQLYYQLVGRDLLVNKLAEYTKLGDLVKKGRMCGLVDWDAIVDRNRVPKIPYSVEDVEDAIVDAADTYRIDRMEDQESYVEVWVEKDALSEILYQITSEYSIRLMVNRGFSSTTAMHDAFIRFRRRQRDGLRTTILYVGDHDPSGLYMMTDIQNRLEEFGVHNVDIVPVCLTKEQIEEYDLPPNPAKLTDPRAKWYIETHGKESWEVDAVDPQELSRLITTQIKSLVDIDKYEEVVARESKERAILRNLPVEREKRTSTIKHIESELIELEDQIANINDENDEDSAMLELRKSELERVLELLK